VYVIKVDTNCEELIYQAPSPQSSSETCEEIPNRADCSQQVIFYAMTANYSYYSMDYGCMYLFD